MIARGIWLTAGTAVIDSHGLLIEANEEFSLWTGAAACAKAGLADVLGRKCAGWDSAVKELLNEKGVFSQIDLQDTSGKTSAWYRLELTRHPTGAVVRICRSLPPNNELTDSAWDQFLDDEEARRELYTRTLRAEAQLKMLSGRWPGVLFSQRPDYTFSFVSQKIEDWTGIAVEDWLKRPERYWDVVHEADAPDLELQFSRWKGKGAFTCTYRLRHVRTGRVTYILERREAILSQNGLVLGYDGAWVDVTRQTIAERRLASAVWKETLGVLTMGLAHDFSNILAGIYALSETYQSMTEEGHQFQEGFALIKRNSMQATQLVQRILQLHQGKVGQRNYHNANELVTDTLDIVRKTVRRINLHTQLAPQQLALYVDPVELRQVLVNLILNASDAMPEGGDVYFETSLHQQITPAAHVQGSFPRLPAVCITVRDTGTGIAPDHLPNIFDPFFTTKPLNKGSGLGLYNAKLFAEKHGGAIAVDSVENEGTTFKIWLALADFSESERLQEEAIKQRKTLLLLEPSAKTIEVTARCLRESGFYVATTVSERQAVELLHSPDYQFDAVMAVVNGRTKISPRLFNEVARLRLPVKTILQISGCNEDEHDSSLLERADLVIGSEVPAADIAARLREALNPANPS